MDRIALEILRAELFQDAEVVEQAAVLARQRLSENHPGHLEAGGYELNRLYNVLEKAFERICTVFENHFEKRGDYHEKLIERVSLAIPNVRPAFLPAESRAGIRELKAFRHLFRHAYDLKLREDRLQELVGTAEKAAMQFPHWIDSFTCAVATTLPP